MKRVASVLTVLSTAFGLVAALSLTSPAGAATANWDPSGQAMPVGDLPGWHQIFADNFANESYPVGSLTGCNQYGCTGAPSLRWGATVDGTPDTSGHCRYYPSKTVSVANGVMDLHVHTDASGTCDVANMYPLAGYLTYGMYSIRFRGDDVPGYKLIDLMWPLDHVHGEIDFPENNLDHVIMGYLHTVAGGSQFQWFKSSAMSTSWHTATLQWTPTRMTFILDGTPIGSTTTDVPQTPMRLAVRAESQLGGAPKPAASAQGDVQIDWVTVYSYDPAPTPGAPSITTVTPGDTTATVAFTAPTDAGGGAITSYTVKAYDVTASARGGQSVTGPAGPLTVTGLNNGDTYEFTVAATNATGTGAASARSADVVPATTPGAPTITTVTRGDAEATIAVAAPTDNGGSPITSYIVWAHDLTNPAHGGESGTAAGRTITVTGLTNGDTYAFNARAINALGTGAASARSADVVPATTPGAPTITTVTPGDAEATIAVAAPTDNGGSPITSYIVWAHDLTNPAHGGESGTAAGRTITVTGLTNGDRYAFNARAINALGTGPASARSGAVIPTA